MTRTRRATIHLALLLWMLPLVVSGQAPQADLPEFRVHVQVWGDRSDFALTTHDTSSVAPGWSSSCRR